jgi:LmbE family N-acetylglucosaminyl deacetylase
MSMYVRPWEPLLGAEHVVRGPLLVLAPHPDDEVIGCGGLIAMHLERGAKVRIMVMTDGGKGDPTGALSGDAYRRLRQDEAREAARRIGGAKVVFLDHPDFGLAAAERAVDDLAREIGAFAPTTLAFPSPFELHPDHRATAVHAHAACKRLAAPPSRLMAYEIGGFQPANLLVDIRPWADRKAHAIEAYASQLPYQDIVGKVRALNRARTVNIDDRAVDAVEGFCLVDPARADAYFAAAEVLVRLVDSMGPL